MRPAAYSGGGSLMILAAVSYYYTSRPHMRSITLTDERYQDNILMHYVAPMFANHPDLNVEHSHSKSKYSEDDIIKMHEFLFDNIFVIFCGTGLPADSRYSDGNQLRPCSSRHICDMKQNLYILCSQPEANVSSP